MKKIFYLFSKSLLSKLALVAILIVGGGNSAWAQKTLPYTYGFENNDLATEGWTMVDCYTSGNTKTGISSTYKKSGTYCFLFSYSTDYPAQYLISPELENSSTGIDISFYYIAHAYTAGTRNFSIGYSTTDTETSSFTFTDYSVDVPSYSSEEWTKFTASCPTNTKYVAIKFTSTNGYLYIDDITIDASEQYKKPTSFAVSSVTSSSATFTWTAGSSETAWQIAYSTDADFTPGTNGFVEDVETNTTATISNLMDGVTYYAYIRSDYGDSNYSNWTTEKVSFIIGTDNTILSSSTSNNNSNIPFISSKLSYGDTKSQFIVSSSYLTGFTNKYITKLTFYTYGSSYASSSWGNATFDVYLSITTESSYTQTNSTYSYFSEGTKVVNSAKLLVFDNKMEITLDTPFLYTSNNLLVTFIQTATGTNQSMTWYGESGNFNTKTGLCTTNSSTSAFYYTPRITFRTASPTVSATLGTNGYTTFACPRPLDLSNLPSGLKAYKAEVDAENSKVLFTEINQAVPANTGILLEGTAGETYAIPVAASGTTPEGNAFLVNSTGGTFEAESGYTYYGMKKATSASDPIVFATFAPATVAIPTNKAYLKVANTPSGLSRQLVCAFSDNTTTAIAEIANRQNGQNSYFNLAGQRVDGSRFTVNGSGLKPGLYIINGKKVVIK